MAEGARFGGNVKAELAGPGEVEVTPMPGPGGDMVDEKV